MRQVAQAADLEVRVPAIPKQRDRRVVAGAERIERVRQGPRLEYVTKLSMAALIGGGVLLVRRSPDVAEA
jgi:hypothetical protein